MTSENNQITVTSPLLPNIDDFIPLLKDIWERKWITNNGYYHQQLEKKLAEFLDVPYISLFTNGTIPLLVAIQALKLGKDGKNEIITTPYSFVATSNALVWNNLKPVFVDIEPETGNIDPTKIESAITDKTCAILPVHVYGNPCNTVAIQKIADKYGIKVIYDAAHAFNVKRNGNSILTEGDLSTLSFHATKTYNTVEGGGIICKDKNTKDYIDSLKNFGYTSETYITEAGINGKLDEIRAAYGILNLSNINNAIAHRKHVAETYRSRLKNVSGISFFAEQANISYNYSYFPIFVDSSKYYLSRDELFTKLRNNGILSRRYFYPLITNFSPYENIASARKENLPVANKMADTVLCLPIHHLITDADLERIINLIINN